MLASFVAAAQYSFSAWGGQGMIEMEVTLPGNTQWIVKAFPLSLCFLRTKQTVKWEIFSIKDQMSLMFHA